MRFPLDGRFVIAFLELTQHLPEQARGLLSDPAV